MKKITGTLIHLVIFAFLFVGLFSNCAKVVNPTGGPRDSIPPVPVRAEPPNYSVNFNSKSIEIEFNEFIQLKDIKKQFISSPPFKKEPVIEEKGKEIAIEIEDTLKDSTTYTLNFGNSIVDFHEGNPLKNYRYVFSTGKELDSLELRGKILDAYTMEPRENVLVMLYSRNKDSIPYFEIPEYVSRTNEKGQYYIANIRLDSFKLFALDDLNSNYLYDSPDENIGFTDSLVKYEKELVEIHDTVFEDTLIGPDLRKPFIDSVVRVENGKVIHDTLMLNSKDSILTDTIFYTSYVGYTAQYKNLRLFNEENRPQYLKTTLREDKRKISFVFNRPIIDSLRYQLIDSTSIKLSDVYLRERKDNRDTISYWLKDSSLYNRELLTYAVEYQRRDSLNKLYWHKDTVEFRYTFSKEKVAKQDTIKVKVNISSGQSVDLNQDIRMKLPYPIRSFDTARICLWEKMDTVLQEQALDIHKSEEDMYRLTGKTDWKPNTSYEFIILPKTIHPIYEFYHDTVQMEFSTRQEDFYGEIVLNMEGFNKNQHYLVELLNESDKKIRERRVEKGSDHKLTFLYLHPGKYRIRVVEDRNNNRKWDTGDYLEHLQPENVIYYPEKIDVRANWEMDIDWNYEKTNK